MILYILVAVLTVLLGLTVQKAENGRSSGITRQQALNAVSLFFMFLILFAVAASRLNVGNDYAKYVEFMHLTYCNAYVPTEVGFNLLTKAIYGISGFENYLLVFAIFAFFTVLLFLQAIYRQAESFGFSFFLFIKYIMGRITIVPTRNLMPPKVNAPTLSAPMLWATNAPPQISEPKSIRRFAAICFLR